MRKLEGDVYKYVAKGNHFQIHNHKQKIDQARWKKAKEVTSPRGRHGAPSRAPKSGRRYSHCVLYIVDHLFHGRVSEHRELFVVQVVAQGLGIEIDPKRLPGRATLSRFCVEAMIWSKMCLARNVCAAKKYNPDTFSIANWRDGTSKNGWWFQVSFAHDTNNDGTTESGIIGCHVVHNKTAPTQAMHSAHERDSFIALSGFFFGQTGLSV